ncbi:citrate lyase holo-[acyl-carrier protein] synthase [Streptococcus didelphis]|uniref:citrate lyase holo-[acyl-carrier protein] synthase n=1 Tax=Streptococcus didelphis TaxID=102886 RepID=A0ABY9LIF6_9STRE|nr:citrate lyase holo-[acyl-carrier protein] synthase [Streptococcus didelphis]WMB27945.1 citrate lyase holo-[acyl-carrier protein] synthase [Streptococcus didelphis]WMB29588.1 citrate lyase holo-[acyl-carrier protein] synthase [Streptococcus didelphis]
MFKNELFNGEISLLAEVLAAREQRTCRQMSLLRRYPKASLLSVTMNIPGPVKTSPLLTRVYQNFLEILKEKLEAYPIVFEECLKLKTGWEYYCLVDFPAQQLKEKMIAIESESPVGRIMDLDVLCWEKSYIQIMSRQHIGLDARKCYICSKNAKACGRSRKHSIKELQKAVYKILLPSLKALKEE